MSSRAKQVTKKSARRKKKLMILNEACSGLEANHRERQAPEKSIQEEVGEVLKNRTG
jgi:hypothetical protein